MTNAELWRIKEAERLGREWGRKHRRTATPVDAFEALAELPVLSVREGVCQILAFIEGAAAGAAEPGSPP